MNITPCSGTTLNWNSLIFTSLPSGFSTAHPYASGQLTQLPNAIIIYASAGTVAGNYTVFYTIADTAGITSGTGMLFVQIPDISKINTTNLVAYNAAVKAPINTTIGTEIRLGIANQLSDATNINWSSFTITTAPTNGTSYFDANTRELVYIVQSTSQIVDKINWRITTNDNKTSNVAVFAVDLLIGAAPVANNDTFCAKCGIPSALTDVTANDTPGSLADIVNTKGIVITQYPLGTTGVLNVNNDGKVIFTPTITQVTPVTFKYKVPNQDGLLSNEATVTINVACAGVSPGVTIDITCYASKILNLAVLTGGSGAAVGSTTSWVETTTGTPTYASQGGTITGGYLGTVNFTTKSPGLYSFRGTSTISLCTSIADVSILVGTVPSFTNDTCGGATTLTYPPTGGSTTFQSQTNLGSCPVLLNPTESQVTTSPVSPEQNPPSWNTTRSGDLWYTFTVPSTATVLDITIEMNGVSYGSTDGVKNPQVALYNSSGTPCAIDDLNIISHAAQISNAQYILVGVSTLAAGTTYWLRVSTGETVNAGKFSIILISGLTA